jgi:hypothetical protein
MSLFDSAARFTLNSYPFNYLVIEDAFEPVLSLGLSCLFRELIVDARGIGKVGEVGELVYDALNFTPRVEHVRQTALAAIASVELREFVSSAFSIRLDENLMIGLHRHQPGSRAGWPHTDFAIVSFPDEPPNIAGLRYFHEDNGCNYADDSRDRQPSAIKTARSIACLYFTANPDWQPGMEGETGIYADLGNRLVDRIPPRNNSLLIFEISPISYHAFLGSSKVQRNSYIWWYHSNPGYLLERHAAAADFKRSQNQDAWDRWTDSTVAKYDPYCPMVLQ